MRSQNQYTGGGCAQKPFDPEGFGWYSMPRSPVAHGTPHPTIDQKSPWAKSCTQATCERHQPAELSMPTVLRQATEWRLRFACQDYSPVAAKVSTLASNRATPKKPPLGHCFACKLAMRKLGLGIHSCRMPAEIGKLQLRSARLTHTNGAIATRGYRRYWFLTNCKYVFCFFFFNARCSRICCWAV